MTDRSDDGGGDDGSAGNGDGRTSWAERFLLVVSALFTVLLFAFVVWQAATTPSTGVPVVTVAGTEPHPDGLLVTVVLENPRDLGVLEAVVSVECDSPPPTITFQHVPADDRQTGYVVCPAGNGTPAAKLSSWKEA